MPRWPALGSPELLSVGLGWNQHPPSPVRVPARLGGQVVWCGVASVFRVERPEAWRGSPAELSGPGTVRQQISVSGVAPCWRRSHPLPLAVLQCQGFLNLGVPRVAELMAMGTWARPRVNGHQCELTGVPKCPVAGLLQACDAQTH